MTNLFRVGTISETKRALSCTEQDAWLELEATCRMILKNVRWHPFYSRIKEIQKPLLKLKLARKMAKNNPCIRS